MGGRAGRGGVLAALAGLFVEPAQEDQAVTAVAHADDLAVRRPVVAVAGFRRRCGTTTVARALAAELAARDATGAAVATAAALASGGVPLGTPAAGRLGRAVQRALPTRTRVAGRLCLTLSAVGAEAELVGALRGIAPIVLDVDDPACASVAASLADAIVVVAGPATEPALAPVLAGSLARVGPPPIVVLNRARDADAGWDRHAAVALPESRMGAQLALAGREARGELGRAVARLADLVGEAGTR
ncbi:MAG: hypothetical protein GXY03_13485 [Solirubrobacterales bacterium]|nr:hypothetical protein [Solirubrobacterales bacterium]